MSHWRTPRGTTHLTWNAKPTFLDRTWWRFIYWWRWEAPWAPKRGVVVSDRNWANDR
jgi:hypothetical protein